MFDSLKPMDVRPFQQCRSLDGWCPVEVNSTSQADVNYVVLVNPWGTSAESICECKGYTFTGHCKHQTQALKRICGWAEAEEETQTESQRRMHVCPRCGGPTSWQMEVIE